MDATYEEIVDALLAKWAGKPTARQLEIFQSPQVTPETVKLVSIAYQSGLDDGFRNKLEGSDE